MKKNILSLSTLLEVKTLKVVSLSKLILGAIFFMFALISHVSFAQVSGTIYKDFDMNGTKGTASPNLEVGMAGVLVKATKPDGTALTVAYTGGGSATNNTGGYSVSGGTLGQIRLEFVMPDTYTYASNGAAGGTSVLFPSGATQDLGVNYPADYCQGSPDLVTACYVNGRPTGAGNDVIVKFPYNATGQTSVNSYLAQADQIGSTWGVAYNKEAQIIYTSAFIKRHVSLMDNDNDGKEDIGAIYTMTATGSPVLWKDLSTLGIDFGLSLFPTIAARGLPLVKTTGSFDTDVFDLVGKVGIGDIDISEDNTKLFVVNLYDKKLYTIDIATKTLVGTGVLVPNECSGGASRPFGLTVHRGKVYVGSVCDAETSQAATDLKANLYRLDGAAFTNILTFPLNYIKGGAFQSQANIWNPWKNSFYPVFNWGPPLNDGYPMWPQPIFSDIEFDVNEDVILTFVDRLGHQTGVQNRGTNPGDSKLYDGVTGGDILRAALVNGTYVIENNAMAGGVTTAGAGNNQGPGGGEFYFQENYGNHNETVQGGIALLAGSGDVAVISMDPFAIYSAGTFFLNNTTGVATRKYEIVPSNQSPAAFGKANGLGDVELLCNLAPVEIGNRVWDDIDSDGIQDAGEVGLSGVTVTLYAANGTTVVSTATTDANGNYFFSSAAGTSTGSAKYGLSLSFKTNYVLSFPTTSGTKNLTLANGGGNDVLDSDADVAGKVTFTTGYAGENNHSFDVGYKTNTITIVTCPGPYGGAGAIGDPAQWVVIGDPGNPADGPAYSTMVNGSPVVHNDPNQVGYGSVNYTFSIADGFVTIKDYLRFLNSVDPTNTLNFEGDLLNQGLVQYSSGVWSAGSFYCISLTPAEVEKVAVTRISLNQKARYANWVATGNVNTGAYTFASADGNANITAIDNAFTGVRLLTENEYYKAAFWDQANNTYNLYGTTGLQANGTPIVSGIGSGGVQTNPLGVVYTLTSPDPNICWPQVQSGQGGRSAYGVSNMAGGFHNSMIPNAPSFPITNDVLRPDNLASAEAGQRSSYRNNFISASGFYPSPSFQIARTGNACLCEVVVVTAEPTPCNTSTNKYDVSGMITFPTAPSSGTLSIQVDAGTPIVLNPPFLSPISYNVTALNSDGATHTIKATFSASANCEGTKTYTAPPSCICITPTVGTPVATQATCNAAGTAANNDASIAIPGITNATVYAYTTDGSTPAFAGATAVSGGAINLTGLANPAAATTYKFRIFNGSATCYTDVTATLNPKTCSPTCTTPTNAAPTTTAGTCTGSALNNDASISITTIVGDKAAISTAGAASFDGAAYASATAVSGGSITFSNLQHNKAYIIKIYNTAETCYKELTFTTANRTCCSSPNCGTVTINKN